MRIFSSQSSVMNAHCGSTSGLTTVRLSPNRLLISSQYATDAEPMGSAPMCRPDFAMTSRSMIEGRSETYESRKSKGPVVAAARAASFETRFTPSSPASMSSLARAAIHSVASESAGPPWGGLYLKPPSAGGLWDGVMTMPSACSSAPDALYLMIAWDSAGVGVKPSRESSSTFTPLAASTSSAVSCAGPDSACVSLPMNSGPAIPCPARYSTIACVMAAIWVSLNEVLSDDPRCPDVPNATR